MRYHWLTRFSLIFSDQNAFERSGNDHRSPRKIGTPLPQSCKAALSDAYTPSNPTRCRKGLCQAAKRGNLLAKRQPRKQFCGQNSRKARCQAFYGDYTRKKRGVLIYVTTPNVDVKNIRPPSSRLQRKSASMFSGFFSILAEYLH